MRFVSVRSRVRSPLGAFPHFAKVLPYWWHTSALPEMPLPVKVRSFGIQQDHPQKTLWPSCNGELLRCSCHRSHFGSRYKLGCCGHAGLFAKRFDSHAHRKPEHAHSLRHATSFALAGARELHGRNQTCCARNGLEPWVAHFTKHPPCNGLDVVMCCVAACHHKCMDA